ncbi:hypothetical protein [Halarchaeum sp. P4]|uniref:hypothetical protein n=1 Tax=Halarchaeum sp. P4 TaxID=3421639 RepID=UPI003EB9512C
MTERRYQTLVQFVSTRAQRYFRTAVHYTEDGWEALYRRGDLPAERAERRTSAVVEKARARDPLREPDSPFGDLDATVELYENGVFIIIRESATEGVIVSLERDAARNLAGFVVECERIVSGD